ncbi:MAG: YceD family protein [Actinomycetota bacterium]
MTSPVRVPVAELVDHPGETREVISAVPPESFGEEPWGPTITAVRGEVELELHLDAVVEGILVRGRLGFDLEMACARCLAPKLERLDVQVAELFIDPTKRDVDEDEEPDPGYELIDGLTAIDLTTMVRDAVLLDLPVRVLCREDCQGLCPRCGADRNHTDCGHRPGEEPDPRWAKLAELDLPTE